MTQASAVGHAKDGTGLHGDSGIDGGSSQVTGGGSNANAKPPTTQPTDQDAGDRSIANTNEPTNQPTKQPSAVDTGDTSSANIDTNNSPLHGERRSKRARKKKELG